MAPRGAHLVGSLPGTDAAEAMETALQLLGPHLRTLPDGETGERRNWIVSIMEDLRRHPDLEVTSEGDYSDYDAMPSFRVRRGHRLYGATMDFGHVEAARTSRPAFEELRSAYGRSDLTFQAGVPGDLDLALFLFGPAGALRHRRAFTEATLAEIHGVGELWGGDVVFQIEVPAELVLLARAPAPAAALLAGRLAAGIVGLVLAAPAGSRFGLHLCLGDMNNKAFGTMTDVSPLVALTAAVLSRWPTGRTLEYVHAPFAAGDQPATTAAEFYAPLARLRLPSGVRFAAGFAHEEQSLVDQRLIQNRVEDLLGRPVDVAAACGLGRRTASDGRRVLERMAELIDVP